MHPNRLRFVAISSRTLGAIAAASVVLTGACAGGGGGEADKAADPIELVTASSAKTLAAGTSRMSLVAETTVGGKTVVVAADGMFDYAAQRGLLTMDLSKLGIPGATGKAEILLAGKIFYMKFPGLSEMTGQPTKQWVKVDLNASGGIDPTGLAGVGSNDPSAFVAMLRGASDDLRKVGEEALRGDPTTHYRGTFDLRKALAAAPASAKQVIERSIEQLGTSKLPMDVWLDEEGRLRKLVQTVDVGKSAAAGSSTVPANSVQPTPTKATVTIELFDFGTPVEVVEPPADQVADISSLTNPA